MNIREAILDALIDGGESIIQIQEYMNYLGLNIDREKLIRIIETLFNQGKIYIEYPHEEIDELDIAKIEDYWFGLTP